MKTFEFDYGSKRKTGRLFAVSYSIRHLRAWFQRLRIRLRSSDEDKRESNIW